MRKNCRAAIDDQVFFASCGDNLLDAALINGVEIPHDCRSGHCGTCRVRVLEGRVIGGDSGEPDAVRACQCRLISDVRFEVEDVPPILITPGRVSALKRVAPDVVELTVELVRGATYLPG